MNKELRRVSTLVLFMFLALFTSTSIIQVFQQDTLKADGRNVRVLYASYSIERGDILVDGVPIAESLPVDDQFKFQRTYPQGPLYAPVTGYFTLNQGNAGIEGALNDYLTGQANEQFLDQLNSIITGQSPRGAAVELTLDPVVQQAAWDALGDYTGAVVALDPQTGEILAMVSKPSYDPNVLTSRNTQEVIDAYEALLADPGDPLINRAISGDLNPPGSTFKVLMTAAALNSGEFTPESEFPNPPTLTLPGTSSTIRNAGGSACGGGANASIATSLRLSCNIGFAQLAAALGYDRIAETAEEFGFGDDELRIPLRVEPSVYPSAIEGDEPQIMLSGFGQSSVRATPLQIAMISAAVANGGTIMMPNLVESIIAPDLSPLQEFQPQQYRQPMSSEVADTIRQLMVDNVSNGAASNARIEGVEVGGKTGTAENGPDEPYTLWFTGFAPAQDPQVAVAVVIEDGGGRGQSGFGNQLAAPVARAVMEAVLSR